MESSYSAWKRGAERLGERAGTSLGNGQRTIVRSRQKIARSAVLQAIARDVLDPEVVAQALDPLFGTSSQAADGNLNDYYARPAIYIDKLPV